MPRLTTRAFACLAAGAVVGLAGCAQLPDYEGSPADAPWLPDPAERVEAFGDDAGGAGAGSSGEPELLIFGDSWTVGLAATTEYGGYAYLTGDLLDWPTVVAGESGSGYLRPGHAGGTYGTRILALDPDIDPDIVVIQGSINDRNQPFTGYSRAVRGAWAALEARFPDAQLVVLGPAPHLLPIDEGVQRADDLLQLNAAAEDLTYISPIDEGWITEENFDAVIDTSPEGNYHPSDAGHAHLADLLAAHLADLAGDDEPATVDEALPQQ